MKIYMLGRDSKHRMPYRVVQTLFKIANIEPTVGRIDVFDAYGHRCTGWVLRVRLRYIISYSVTDYHDVLPVFLVSTLIV